MLGVSRDADGAELKAAYEKAITAAARAGHLETAKRIDAAYEVLRNPSRRAMFDRSGVVHEVPRVDPTHSYYAPTAVPWRTWSPEEQTAASPTRQVQRRKPVRTGVVVALAAAVALSLVVDGGVLHRGGGAFPASDVTGWSGTTSPQAPPATASSRPQRLLPPVAGPVGAGGYDFASMAQGRPVRWDPCRPIHYVISGTEPFVGADSVLTEALGAASAASGLQFVYSGTTTEQPVGQRAAYQPGRYGKQWAPVLIAWTDAGTVPRLDGNVVGLGGPASATVHGSSRLVSGIVYFDAPELALMAQRPNGFALTRTVMLHEIGHLLGLGHVPDPGAVMYPSSGALVGYGDGDLRGLAFAGSAPCSRFS